MFDFTHVDQIQATNSFPPPRELFRFGQGFLHLCSDLIITSPLYGNPTLLLLTKQPETRHFSPSQSLDSSFRMDVAALRRSLLSQSRIYENLTLLVLRRSRNCGTTHQRTHKPWQGTSRSPYSRQPSWSMGTFARDQGSEISTHQNGGSRIWIIGWCCSWEDNMRHTTYPTNASVGIGHGT